MTSIVQPSQAFGERRAFGEPRLHTDGELLLLSYARDGSLLSVEEPGVLRRWDGATGQPFDWHALSDVETVWGFSPDGRVLASASDDLTIWDTSSGLVLTALTQDSWVTALGFGPDPGFIATGHDDGTIRYWDAPGHCALFPDGLCWHQQPISAVAISPDGRLLAAAGEDKVITLWDLDDGRLLGTLAGHTDRIPALAWHPRGRLLISAGWDGNARVWDVETLQPVFLFNGHEGGVTAIALSADGRLLATADAGPSVRLWDFERKRGLFHLTAPEADIRSLSFSPDGRRLASNGDRMIHLWDTATGQPLAGAGPRPAARPAVAVSPDGRLLVANGGGSDVRVWDAATLTPLRSLEAPGSVHAIAFSPDGRRIAGAAEDRIRLWDAATGQVIADWDGPEEPITALAFSADGSQLASGSDSGFPVWLWRTGDGEPVLLIPDALDGCAVETLAFHPDGQVLAVGGIDWLATGGSSGAVSLWNLPGRFETALVPDGTTALAFHPSGSRLAFATLEGGVGIWGIAERDLLAELTGHDANVSCLAYRPDGQYLATGGEDNTVRLWDEQGEEVALLEVESRPTALAFSPDGTTLFIAHANTTCSRVRLPAL